VLLFFMSMSTSVWRAGMFLTTSKPSIFEKNCATKSSKIFPLREAGASRLNLYRSSRLLFEDLPERRPDSISTFFPKKAYSCFSGYENQVIR
jgi:hypothetical protein